MKISLETKTSLKETLTACLLNSWLISFRLDLICRYMIYNITTISQLCNITSTTSSYNKVKIFFLPHDHKYVYGDHADGS